MRILFHRYQAAHPAEAAEFTRRVIKGELPDGWQAALPEFPEGSKGEATRSYSGKVLNAAADAVPELLSGSADLTPSNKTWLNSSHDFQHETPDGRYIRYGVREHGMAAVANGMAAYGGVIPACATFLTFVGCVRVLACVRPFVRVFSLFFVRLSASFRCRCVCPCAQTCLSALPSFLPVVLPSLLPSFLASFLPPFLPSFLLSFLTSLLDSFLACLLPSFLA